MSISLQNSLQKSIKWTSSIVGLLGSGLVISYGILNGVPVMIIGGVISIIPTFTLCYQHKLDSQIQYHLQYLHTQLGNYELELNKYHVENNKLRGEKDIVEISRNSYNKENKSLRDLYSSAELKIKELIELQVEHKTLQDRMSYIEKENKLYSLENIELKNSVKKVIEINDKYSKKYSELRSIVNDANDKLQKLDEYKKNNDNLIVLYNKSKDVINTLMKAQDLLGSNVDLQKSLELSQGYSSVNNILDYITRKIK